MPLRTVSPPLSFASVAVAVAVVAVAFVSVTLLASCGGSGDDDGGSLDVVAPLLDAGGDVAAVEDSATPALDVVAVDVALGDPITFTPAADGGPGGAVWLTADIDESAPAVVVHVWAGGFDDVLGWAFDLRYHPGVLSLEDVTLHDVLTEGTFRGRCVARERGAGRLNVGCARFLVGEDLFGDAARGGALEGPAEFATLRFAVADTGTATLTFDESRRLARGGVEPFLSTIWRGGVVQVDRLPGDASASDAEGGAR